MIDKAAMDRIIAKMKDDAGVRWMVEDYTSEELLFMGEPILYRSFSVVDPYPVRWMKGAERKNQI